MELNLPEWNGMEWIGMEWNGMECNGMEWNGINPRTGEHTTEIESQRVQSYAL